MTGRADAVLTLAPHEQRIAESLGIRTREELTGAAEALERYLLALEEVGKREHWSEASPDEMGQPSLN